MDNHSFIWPQSIRYFDPQATNYGTGSPVVDYGLPLLILCAVIVAGRSIWTWHSALLPIINEADFGEVFTSRAKLNFQDRAEELMRQGFEKGWQKFRLITDSDSIIVLSPDYAEELMSDPRLSFSSYNAKELHSNIPGFDAFKASTTGTLLLDTIRTRLTQTLNTVTSFLPAEADDIIQKEWTNNADWHTVDLYSTMLRFVAQMSSRVFLGPELCRDPEWQRITIDHAVSSFSAAAELRSWPSFLRPLVHWFLPSTRALRAQVAEARRIIGPVVEKRKRELAEGGHSQSQIANAVAWFEDVARGRIQYDPVAAQLILAVAAVHSTADLLCQTIIDLCRNEHLLGPLREEAANALKQHGWTKMGLQNMKLMDSVLKESQRLKPIANVSMRRMATEDIRLKDGTFIAKGQTLCVSAHSMRDVTNYASPTEFDGYRFLKRADDPTTAKTSSLATPSPQHFGFGFGKLACPGRHLAANEAKILLLQILLKYELRLDVDYKPRILPTGFTNNVDHSVKLEVHRRTEEVDM